MNNLDQHNIGQNLAVESEGPAAESCTVALKVAYDGAPFCGFARQPGQLTVQGDLENALSLVFRRPVETVCSGRTDAGVHALGQVVSFDLDREEWDGRNPERLMRSLNALTQDRISVRGVAEAKAGFSARFDAEWREYHYHICAQSVPPMFMKDFSWHLSCPLDLEAMRKGASYLIGEHDFKSFCMAVSAVGKPTCRNVHDIQVYEEDIMGDRTVVVKVVGNAFLHSMVRTIVGTLVAVGRSKRSPEWVGEVLEARDRTAAGENAPAAGLVFWRVHYPEECGIEW